MEELKPAPQSPTLPVIYQGIERQYPLDIHVQRRRVHYHVCVDGVNIAYESDGVDGLYTTLPSDPQAIRQMPPMGLVHAVKNALLTMMSA